MLRYGYDIDVPRGALDLTRTQLGLDRWTGGHRGLLTDESDREP